MIDASKSPTPAWQRYAMAILLSALILVVGYAVWIKELHHGSAPSGTPAANSPSPAATATVSTTVPTSTTVPGGLPISSRNPFGS